MQRLLCVGMSALLLALLGGCGLKYDLYLPDSQNGSSTSQTELTIFSTEESAEAGEQTSSADPAAAAETSAASAASAAAEEE